MCIRFKENLMGSYVFDKVVVPVLTGILIDAAARKVKPSKKLIKLLDDVDKHSAQIREIYNSLPTKEQV
jgi:hypothetical protein